MITSVYKFDSCNNALAGVWMLLLGAPLWVGFNAPLRAQGAVQDWQEAAGGKQSFEVASVREDKAGGESYSNFDLDNGNLYWVVKKDDVLAPSGSLLTAKNQTLLRYIVFAYKLGGTQELALRFDPYKGLKVHVPDWVNQGRYDIEARAPGPATKDQMRLMMQSLLAERFNLKVHWETQEVPVLALVREKSARAGSQIEPHPASDDCAATKFPESKNAAAPTLAALPIPCGMIAHLPASAPGAHRFGGRDVTLAMLATSLPTQTGLATLPRPVIDRTGLPGGYDFSLEWTPEDTSEVNNHETGGSFNDALKEQLGLKLESQNGPVEVMVIDHVEPPTPN
jgi:uncharacterized protein (TIGR03435 family)